MLKRWLQVTMAGGLTTNRTRPVSRVSREERHVKDVSLEASTRLGGGHTDNFCEKQQGK